MIFYSTQSREVVEYDINDYFYEGVVYMKKFFCVVSALVMFASLLAGCGGQKSSSDGQTLIIGGSGPLTGDYATYGISVKQGAELAVKEINESGGINGIKFEVKYEDDQADPTAAVNAYATLMDAGMKVSLGGVTSGACIAVTEEAKKDGILMLTPSGSQKECTQYDNCFRVCFTDPDQGTYAADFIKENNVAEKVAIIYDKSNDYSAGITSNFLKEAEAIGLSVVTTQAFTDQSKTDFTVQLQAAKDSGADLVFLPIYAQEAAYILTQAQKVGLDVTFFGCDGLDGILEKIGKDNLLATEGVMLLTPFAADAADEKTQSFVSAYKKSYGLTPDQFAADGYDAIYTIAAALKESGIKDINAKNLNEKLIAAMTKITVDGVTGSMTWDAGGEPTKSATAVKIVNGAYVAYEK